MTPREAYNFFLKFILIIMAAVVLITTPVYFGTSTNYLTLLTPVFQWIPFLAIVALVGVHYRARPEKRTFSAIWNTAGARVGNNWGPILKTCAWALLALLVVAIIPLLICGSLEIINLTVRNGAIIAVLFTLPITLFFMLFTAGEELAWRGYLTSILSFKGFFTTTALIGLMWATWHLPLTIAYWYTGEFDGRDVFSKTIDLLFAAVFLSALRYLSGSVWPAIFAHSLLTNLFQMIQSNFMEPVQMLSTPSYWSYMLISWLAWLCVNSVLVYLVLKRTNGKLPVK